MRPADFARDAEYSDSYAIQTKSGHKQMLVVEVLVGKWAKGAPGMKKCPLLPDDRIQCHDSLVDNIADPAIFVVQNSNQAYPAYVITYHSPASQTA